MKYNKLIAAIVFAGAMALSSGANAAHDGMKYSVQDPQGKNYASQGILYHVNNARVAIANGRDARAMDHINYAINLNNFVQGQHGSRTIENRVAVEKYTYSKNNMAMNVYFPVSEYSTEWQKYNRHEYNESRRNLKLAKGHSDTALIILDTDYMERRLAAAQQALMAKDNAHAEDILENVIDNSLLVAVAE